MVNSHIPDPLYHQILTHIPIACVDIVIVSLGAVLLVKRNDPPAKGEWWLPGGRVLKGEMMRDTARRKALEEVGLEVHVGPIVHTAETIFEDGPGGIAVHSVNSCFVCYSTGSGLSVGTKINSHHTGYRWIIHTRGDFHPYVKACLLGAGFE